MSPCVRLRAAGETANPCLHFHNSLHILSECSRVPGEWPGAVTRGAGERSQDTASRVTRVTRVTGRSHAVIITHISRDTILGSRGGGGFIFSRNMQTTVDNLHTLEDCSTAPPRARPAAQRAINITLPAVSRVRGSCLGLNTGHSAQWPELGGRSGARTPDHACPSAVLYR